MTAPIVWTLTCGGGRTQYVQKRGAELQKTIESRVGVLLTQARRVAKRDKSGIISSYVNPPAWVAERGRFNPLQPSSWIPDSLWIAYAWYLRIPYRVNDSFLRSLGGLVVKMRDGRSYILLRTALPVNDPYALTRLVYRILKRDDVEFVDRIRGAPYERDASIIRTKAELYAWLATPGGLPSSPTMPALMLPQHLVRELEEFANLQVDFMRKQFMNLEYLFNIRARRLAARLQHQLEAELQALRNRLRQYEVEFQNTVTQTKVAAQTAQTSPDYIRQLENYVNQAKQRIKARIEELSQEIRRLTEQILASTERTTTHEAPPGEPYRPDQWRQAPTPGSSTTLVGEFLQDPKILLVGIGGAAALWYLLRR